MIVPRTPLLAQRSNSHIAKGHWPVVSLKQEGTGRVFLVFPGISCRMENLNVVVNQLPVEYDSLELSVGNLLPLGVKSGSMEHDLEGRPFARLLRGIDSGGNSVIQVMVVRFHFASGINSATVGTRELPGLASRVVDLDFVDSVQLDAGIGMLGDHELQLNFKVAPFLTGNEIMGAACLAVDNDARAFLTLEPPFATGINTHTLGRVPVAQRFLEMAQAVGEDDPAFVGRPCGRLRSQSQKNGSRNAKGAVHACLHINA